MPQDLRRGFSLLELLVVIAIIALLIAILLPTLGQARESGKAIACASRMRQLAIGADLYADANDDRYPPRSRPRWVAQLTSDDGVGLVIMCPSDPEGAGGTDDNVDEDRVGRSYFINGFNDWHLETVPGATGVDASEDRSMVRGAIWQPSEVGLFGEKKSESTHFYLDLLEGVGNDFTELEPSRHGERVSNYAFVDTSVTTIRHPEALTPVNIWGVTSWGRSGEGPPDP